ncbi:MAG TPA: TRAP transporter large permease subunit [Xanthobacteraceae bacterium]|nr:TRAP transporter large permease subunit [Xanthobacteraceae bacterium]
MGLADILALALVAAVCLALMAGYPVALTLGGVALAFALLGDLTGTMPLALLGAFPQRVFGVMSNDVLLAIPLFIFMGVMLERSRIAEDLLESMGRLFGSLRGGLAISVTIVGVLLAAAKGVVGATTVTMGLITLPTMLRHGYDPRLAAGTVAATSTLAQIMPPATVLVLLGDQLNTAYQAAQLAKGTFAPDSVSVGDLFAGAIFPALMLVGLYLAFQVGVAILRPAACPPIPPDPVARRGLMRMASLGEALVAPILLIIVVLGSILAGLATPTEAAAIGGFGALLLTARKLDHKASWPVMAAIAALLGLVVLRAIVDPQAADPTGRIGLVLALGLMAIAAAGTLRAVAIVRRAGVLRQVLASTAQITSMIFTILIGATLFSLVFRGLGGDDLVQRALSNLPGGTAGAILAVMLAMFLLGFVMDAFEIIFVVVPIVAPPLLALHGVNPVWLGILMAMNLQTSYMHPPLGPTLFYLRGVAPPQITTLHIYVGIIPFVLIQIVALVLLWMWPGLATWLPRVLYAG